MPYTQQLTRLSPNPFAPAVPVGAYDRFVPSALERSAAQPHWQPADGRLPVMYLSHGAPQVLDEPEWLEGFLGWALSLPKPRGIAMVSAHWEAAPVAISATDAGVPLYYDFGGFHRRYYEVTYRTPDASALAGRVVGALAGSGPVHRFTDRGLDHGAFVPLMAMYPLGDVPVIQVSMPSLAPADLHDLGRRLAGLRDEGILVVGSGQITHWFGAMRIDPAQWGTLAAHNADFEAWALDAVRRGDLDALTDFRRRAPSNTISHRTADHFVPLLTALGAADRPTEAATTIDGVWMANSVRSLQFD